MCDNHEKKKLTLVHLAWKFIVKRERERAKEDVFNEF